MRQAGIVRGLFLVTLVASGAPVAGQARSSSDPQGAGVSDTASVSKSRGPEAARAHFQRGRGQFEARRYRDAIHNFELAYALWPEPDLLFNIGRAYEELGDAAAAISYLHRYLRDAVDAADAAAVRDRLHALQARMERAAQHRQQGERSGALHVVGLHPGAVPRLNGEDRPELAGEGFVDIAQGEHKLEVASSAPGQPPKLAIVQVRPGELTTAVLSHETALPRSDAAAGPSALVIGSSLAAIACIAGAATMSAVAQDKEPPPAAMSLGSDLLLGTGLLTALVSVVVYFADASDD